MDWNWEELKREIDVAHRLFFEKRGIDPESLKRDFLFGKPRPRHEGNPSSSESMSDQPIQQSSARLNRNQVDQLL